MNKTHHVCLKVVVNIKMCNVPSDTPQEAAESAACALTEATNTLHRMFDHTFKPLTPELHPDDQFFGYGPRQIAYTEFADSIPEAIVDPAGEEVGDGTWVVLEGLLGEVYLVTGRIAGADDDTALLIRADSEADAIKAHQQVLQDEELPSELEAAYLAYGETYIHTGCRKVTENGELAVDISLPGESK